MSSQNLYSVIIEKIFSDHFSKGMNEISFEREEIIKTAQQLKVKLPKNLGDLIYSFRYRTALPEQIQKLTPKGKMWVIRPIGRAKYQFALIPEIIIAPNHQMMQETKILDATPGIVSKYALTDEQSLLAKLRYNRLVDIFTGVACYSLQNHLRTAVPEMGQVEIDELYVGVDSKGAHYIFPVQAKGGTDKLNIVQIEQDYTVCTHKFPDLICKPIATQFMNDNVIALFVFENNNGGLKIANEKHYRLVEQDELTKEELKSYKERLS